MMAGKTRITGNSRRARTGRSLPAKALKRKVQRDRSEAVAPRLALVFAGPLNKSARDVEAAEGQNQACLEIGHQRLLLNMRAALIQVAVQKCIVQHRPAIRSGVNVPAK